MVNPVIRKWPPGIVEGQRSRWNVKGRPNFVNIVICCDFRLTSVTVCVIWRFRFSGNNVISKMAAIWGRFIVGQRAQRIMTG